MPGEACPECRYLIGHEMDLGTGKPRCSRALKSDREQGWNEAIEAAAELAKKAAGHACNTFGGCTCRWAERLDGLESDIRDLRK